jgi:hypothetical protein
MLKLIIVIFLAVIVFYLLYKYKKYHFIFRNFGHSFLFAVVFAGVWEAISYIIDNTFSLFHKTIPFLGLFFVIFLIGFLTKKYYKQG